MFAARPDAVLPPRTWKLYVFDEPADLKDTGRYGFHRQEGPDATPVGYVFVGLCDRFRESWTEVVSHEVIEMLGDPWVNIDVRRRGPSGLELWPRELCDAVQGQNYRSSPVDGVEVANFVFPEYFLDGADGPYDFLGMLTAPFSVAPSGYSAITKVGTDGRVAAENLFGVHYPAWRRQARIASRRDARYGGLT